MALPSLRPFHSAVAAFRSGADSPSDLLERCIEAIGERENGVQAFECFSLDSARRVAAESTARYRAGKPLSAIDGIPIGIKDIIETADMPTGMGSPLFAGYRSGRDAASVAALREAGAAIVGKTVTTEFAATVAGKTHNPWDLSRTPGGSSSGSAAAVGSGMLCAGLGTQVIGSILRPASYCGCVGYKPTVGGINRGGSVDYQSQSTHGVLAASIDDAWLVAREITARVGGDPGYPGIRGPRTVPPARTPKTLALFETPGWALATDDAKLQLQRAAEALRKGGITIADRRSSADIEAAEKALAEARPLSMRINLWEFRWPLNTFSRDMDHAKLSVPMQQRLVEAEAMTLEEYQDAIARRDEIRAIYARLSTTCDAVISLSAPGPAPVGLASTGEPAFVVGGSLLGVPAISLPLLTTEGLPLGLQVLGFLNGDADLFAHAAAVEGGRAIAAPELDFEESARFCNQFGAHETTIDACRLGLAADPSNAMLHVYRAVAYDELGRLAEAVADCQAALRLAPAGATAVLALITLALVRERLGDSAAAFEAARSAIALQPAEREAHALLGTLLAWHGEYPAAWPELECHWLDERIRYKRRFPDIAEWNGEPIDGKRLLLVHGQGLGDMLQMLRYLPRLRERGAHVMIECPPPMLALVRTLVAAGDTYPSNSVKREHFDAFARLMSLPRLCGEDRAHSPAPYVRAEDDYVATWRDRLPARSGALRVGIAWAGNPAHENDRRRSIPLAAFAPLAEVPGIEWFSLQVGPRANDDAPARLGLTRLGDEIADMSDTAAILAQLDLVISADTSLAHLAGAMGVPVWLALPWRPDWRWEPQADGTPWYPAMRLFHAGADGWALVMSAIADALRGVPGER